MEQANRWPSYYDAATGSRPALTLLTALERFDQGRAVRRLRFAVDLGCGVGRDTVELLARGWRVLAVDSEPEAIKRLLARPDLEHQRRLTARVARFEDTTWGPADLVNASLALPFCPPESFPLLWARIVSSLSHGGRFSGHLFGDRDDWASIADRTHHNRQQVEVLLELFDVELLEEVEREGPTALGTQKHWHIFNIVARKR